MHNGSERKLVSGNEVRLNESRSSWVILLPWFLSVLPIRPLRLRAFVRVCVLSVGAQLPSWIPFKVFSMLILSVVDSPSFKMHSATSQNLKTSFFFFFCRLCTSTAFSPCLPLNLSGTTFTVTPVQVVTATTLRIILSPCVGVSLSVANHGFSYAAFNPWCVGQAQQEGDAFVAFEKCCFVFFNWPHRKINAWGLWVGTQCARIWLRRNIAELVLVWIGMF